METKTKTNAADVSKSPPSYAVFTRRDQFIAAALPALIAAAYDGRAAVARAFSLDMPDARKQIAADAIQIADAVIAQAGTPTTFYHEAPRDSPADFLREYPTDPNAAAGRSPVDTATEMRPESFVGVADMKPIWGESLLADAYRNQSPMPDETPAPCPDCNQFCNDGTVDPFCDSCNGDGPDYVKAVPETTRATYTNATLPVNQTTYNEIKALLTVAQYGHAIKSDGRIDMAGLDLIVNQMAPVPSPELTGTPDTAQQWQQRFDRAEVAFNPSKTHAVILSAIGLHATPTINEILTAIDRSRVADIGADELELRVAEMVAAGFLFQTEFEPLKREPDARDTYGLSGAAREFLGGQLPDHSPTFEPKGIHKQILFVVGPYLRKDGATLGEIATATATVNDNGQPYGRGEMLLAVAQLCAAHLIVLNGDENDPKSVYVLTANGFEFLKNHWPAARHGAADRDHVADNNRDNRTDPSEPTADDKAVSELDIDRNAPPYRMGYDY